MATVTRSRRVEYKPTIPEFFAVVQCEPRQVVARMLLKCEAMGFAEMWERAHGDCEIVPDPYTAGTDASLLGEGTGKQASPNSQPLALLGERRFLVIDNGDLREYGVDWKFNHAEFLTLNAAKQKAKKLRKASPDSSYYVVELFLPDGDTGAFALGDGHLNIPIRARIVEGGAA